MVKEKWRERGRGRGAEAEVLGEELPGDRADGLDRPSRSRQNRMARPRLRERVVTRTGQLRGGGLSPPGKGRSTLANVAKPGGGVRQWGPTAFTPSGHRAGFRPFPNGQVPPGHRSC